jgi:hypothetical protein
LTTTGGSQPRWRGDDGELYYLDYDGNLVSIELNVTSDTIEAGGPQRLFATGLDPDQIVDQYAVTADGDRFLVLLPVPEATPTPISVFVAWTARLLD